MLTDATHDLGRERGLSCRSNARRALPGSSNAAPGSKRCCPPGCARKRFRSVSSERNSLSEDTPFRAALRTALSDRNGGSAEFFNSLLMNVAFALIALLLLASAATAMALRNIIHSALLLVVSWFALALFYLWAGAEFAAFAQVLIYAGAISMVVLFAVLLTQRTLGDFTLVPESRGRGLSIRHRRALAAVLAGAAVAGAIA